MNVKQPSTYAEQLQKLKKRGCIIHNDNMAMEVLRHINYYRFTAYFLPLKLRIGMLMALVLKKYIKFMSSIEKYVVS